MPRCARGWRYGAGDARAHAARGCAGDERGCDGSASAGAPWRCRWRDRGDYWLAPLPGRRAHQFRGVPRTPGRRSSRRRGRLARPLLRDVSFWRTPVQPLNREPLSPERFLSEAAQLHQTWIRRFDAQHRRRPRPPEIEAERLRLVRRLQLVQRLQQETSDPQELLLKLRELSAAPREARLVEGDQPFLTALLQTWEAAQLPQASTIAAGANP